MTATAQFQVVRTGTRRVVAASPAGRPDVLPAPSRPRRVVSPGRVSGPVACSVARPEPGAVLLGLKVGAVSLLTLLAGVVSVSQFVAMALEQPVGHVAGDPFSAHVPAP